MVGLLFELNSDDSLMSLSFTSEFRQPLKAYKMKLFGDKGPVNF
jgi:hypothetical protein